MNWLRRMYFRRQYNKMVKENHPEFMQFKKDYEHTPLDQFYKNGERTFSRKELEYWKLLDIKNNNRISPELESVQDFNKQYEENILKSIGKVHIGTITVNENDKLLEIPLSVDKRTNEVYFDLKENSQKNERIDQVSYNWKPYNSEYVSFNVYEKIKGNNSENQAIDFKGVSILSSDEQYKEILGEIKNNIGKGVSKIHKVHTSETVKNETLIESLKAQNEKLERDNLKLAEFNSSEKEIKKSNEESNQQEISKVG